MPALLEIQSRFLACYEDPRGEAGFDGDCYPGGDTAAAPAPDGVDEMKTRFSAAYARRNACVRTLAGLKRSSPERARLIETILLLTEAIDHLEDVCAPVGLVAEPVMDEDMFVREVNFTHAPVHTPGRPSPFVSSFSMYIPIPVDGLVGKEAGDAP